MYCNVHCYVLDSALTCTEMYMPLHINVRSKIIEITLHARTHAHVMHVHVQ